MFCIFVMTYLCELRVSLWVSYPFCNMQVIHTAALLSYFISSAFSSNSHNIIFDCRQDMENGVVTGFNAFETNKKKRHVINTIVQCFLCEAAFIIAFVFF